jgi:phosphotransferase system HPr (HPr) family protein
MTMAEEHEPVTEEADEGACEVVATLPNRAGLHARSAAQVVKAAAGYRATVTLAFDGRTANARSLMELLRLGARQGHTLRISAVGPDAEAAAGAIGRMIEQGWGEE